MASDPSLYAKSYVLPEPVALGGPVVHGFGRGSKELGIPTANVPVDSVRDQVDALDCGIYYGWATLRRLPQPVKMVMSIGWNPFYGNAEKTIEPHLLATFDTDFYDEEIRLVIIGYLRSEADFTTLEDLIATIHADIAETQAALPDEDAATMAALPYFQFDAEHDTSAQ